MPRTLNLALVAKSITINTFLTKAAAFVRKVLIVMLFATSAKLSVRGIEGLFGISVPLI